MWDKRTQNPSGAHNFKAYMKEYPNNQGKEGKRLEWK